MKPGPPFLVLYILADLIITTLCLGLYSPSWNFDSTSMVDHILLRHGYNYLTSPFDFLLMAALRTAFLFIGSVLILYERENMVMGWFFPMVLYTIACYSCTLVKMLAFSEKPEMLSFPGLWLSCVWSIVSAVLFCCMWYFVLTTKQFNYERILESVSDRHTHVVVGDATTDGNDSNTEASLPEVLLEKERDSTLQHVWRLLAYCKNQWLWFSGGFLFLMIYSLARVFIPLLIGKVISDIVEVRGFESLVHSVLGMAGLLLISTVFGGLRGGCFDYATAKVSRQVRKDLFSSLVNQDIAFFDTTKSGEMVSRLTSDCQTISTTISTNLNVFLRNGVMLVGAVGFMFYLSWRLAMVTFIAVPLIGFITKWYGAYFDGISEKMQDSIGKANHVAEEVLSTMRTVRSFACERREANRFDSKLDETLGIAKRRSVAFMGYTWTTEFCDNIILLAVLFYGGHLVMSGKMTAEQIITFLLYQLQVGENLASIGYVFTGLMESVGASRKVFQYMNREPTIPLVGKLRPPVNGRIDFQDVHFTYPSRPSNPILEGLTLSIGAGETVALVGPSGGGKTSIVSLIEHFYEPQQGSITLDGVPIKDIAHTYYHQKIALVAQEPVLYEGSVRDNIIYGCDFATEDDMLHAAALANVHDFVMELELGYDTHCGEKGVQMSGGQKQRIAIARALVRRPSVLILDEATSALDVESESLVQEALNRCARQRTVLIVAHRLSTIERADRILVIQKGIVVQDGSHSKLMENENGLYHSLVARQLLASKTGEKQ